MGLINNLLSRVGLQVRETAGGALTDNDDFQYRSIASDSAADLNDLNDYSRTKQRRLARQHFFRHPVGKHIILSPVAAIMGAGVQVKADNEEVQAVVDRFVHDPFNDLDWYLDKYCQELKVFGELFLPLFVTPDNADVRLGYLLPDSVEQIVWQEGNAKRPIAVLQKRQAGKFDDPRRLWIIPYPDPAYDNRYAPHPDIETPKGTDESRIVVAEDGSKVAVPVSGAIDGLLREKDCVVAGYAFYHRTNCLVGGRGRSTYESVNDWLKAIDDWFFGTVRNAILQGSFVWHRVVKGATAAKLQEYAKQKSPRPGSVLWTDENETIEALSPKLPEASGIREIFTGILKIIGLGVSLPGHEIGAEDDTNRSTAKESGKMGVAEKKRFQFEIKAMYCSWLDYLVDQKVYKGQLPNLSPADRKAQIVMPEMDATDEGEIATTVKDLSTGLIPLVDANLLLEKDARSVVYSAIGLDLPADADFDQAEADRQSQADTAATRPDRLNSIIRQISGMDKTMNPGGTEA